MKDVAQAATEVSNNFQQTQSYLSQVDNQLTDAKKLENSYQNISTPATVLKLKKQRLGFDNLWENARNARNCSLQDALRQRLSAAVSLMIAPNNLENI